jgi:flagellar basal-body rod protein FlgB
MPQQLEILRMSQAMAVNAAARASAVARNIAQADTPGYKAREVAPFAETYRGAEGLAPRATRAGHLAGTSAPAAPELRLAATGTESPNGNTVSLEGEMMKAVEARRQHDTALAIYRKSLDILRLGLGRRR